MSRAKNCPRNRRDEFIVQELESGEVIAYHRDTHETHCLKPIAAQVWMASDGSTSPSEISSGLSAETVEGDPLDLTHRALTQLEGVGLVEWAGGDGGLSRRAAIAQAAAVAVPLVLSILAPTPAEARTCLPSGAACTSGAQCCSGRCVSSLCL